MVDARLAAVESTFGSVVKLINNWNNTEHEDVKERAKRGADSDFRALEKRHPRGIIAALPPFPF